MALQNFTTYTEVDSRGEVVVTESKADATLARRSAPGSYIIKDYGVDFFDGDYTHVFEVYFDSGSGNLGVCMSYALSNVVGGYDDVFGAAGEDKDQVGLDLFHHAGIAKFRLDKVEDGGGDWETFEGNFDTLYFVTFDRDDDGGANNTGRYTVYIRTGSHAGPLVDTLLLDAGAGEQNDFRYVYAWQSWGTGGSGQISMYTQNLNLGIDVPSIISSILRSSIFGGVLK